MIKEEDIRVGNFVVMDEEISIDTGGVLWYEHKARKEISSQEWKLCDIVYISESPTPTIFKITSCSNITSERGGVTIEPTQKILCFSHEACNAFAMNVEIFKNNFSLYREDLEPHPISEEIVNKLNRVCEMPQDEMSFRGIVNKMIETYIKKNHDYGNAFSEMYDEMGINYGYGKIREKVNRIKTLRKGDAMVENEPLEDALLDCANYCILTLMEYQKHKKDGKEDV